MVMLKGIAAVSNGSACTSSSYIPTHVLSAMGLDETRIAGAIRISWGYMTKELPLNKMTNSTNAFKKLKF